MHRKLVALLFFAALFASCERDDFTITEETERPENVIVIGEGSDVFFRTVVNETDTLNTLGEARYDPETRWLGIASVPVNWQCPDSTGAYGLTGTGVGSFELFTIFIRFANDGSYNVESSNYATAVNGFPVVSEQHCQAPVFGVTIDTIANEVYGIFSGQMIDLQLYNDTNGSLTNAQCENAAFYPFNTVFRLPLTYCD